MASWQSEPMEDSVPDSLTDICLTYCIHNMQSLCVYDEEENVYNLRPDTGLPLEICERLLKCAHHSRIPIDDRFLHMFSNHERTHLKRISLRDCHGVSDNALSWLVQHRPVELDISGCSKLTQKTIHTINKYSQNLSALFVGNSTGLFQDIEVKEPSGSHEFGGDYIFDCPNLRAFSVHNLSEVDEVLGTMLYPFKKLSHLDLSGCEIEFDIYMDCLEEAPNLLSLILYDVPISNLTATFKFISKLTKLRVLDLSQSKEPQVLYSDAEAALGFLVSCLPDLRRLDLSGTNLCGFIREEQQSRQTVCAIPGLEGRHLDFLGLMGCPYDACSRENLPATMVTGDANEEQVMLSVELYSERPDMLVKALNNLFQLFRYSTCTNQKRALNAILNAMKKLTLDRHVQISGSASLFYIVKGDEKDNFKWKIKRAIITAILDGMENHLDEATMMRNGCLTLCHFQIPQDVLFSYERIVSILLKMVGPADQDEFVQRIGIYLLNSLACQVDGQEKQLVGDLGAISTMLEIIQNKLENCTCDEVMEIAWSTMWNVTDETAVNCERFIEGEGMELFLQCLDKFPDKPELLRNMMGLMGNVAEVDYLRPCLMKSEYVSVFSDLLQSKSDGIEVSYNACGVLAHMVSDGQDAWTINYPPRTSVLEKMVTAINTWDLRTKRNINYRSFEPILRLVPNYNALEGQHWAIWALCNLTTMYPQKYCPLVEKEHGIELLSQVISDSRPYQQIRDLAQSVVDLCERNKRCPEMVDGGDMDMADMLSDNEDNAGGGDQ